MPCQAICTKKCRKSRVTRVLQSRKRVNPFYALLVIVGIAFTITATAYFILTLRGSQGRQAKLDNSSSLLAFLDRHGVSLMVGELALLALCTWGAIGTDQWWAGRREEPCVSEIPRDREKLPANETHDQHAAKISRHQK